MIADMHTHILPGIDDGSPDVETSVQMLEAMWQQGIRRVVATPHFYANHDSPERFLRRRAAALQALRQVWHREDMDLRIGAEVYYFDGISDCEALRELAIEGTNLIMVEMPPSPWPSRSYEELLEIHQKWGLTPVIAHLDRYVTPLRSFGIPSRLAELPVLVQINSHSLLHRSTRAMALGLLRSGCASLLGSDCHSMNSRKPDLGEAWEIVQDKLNRETLRELSRLEDTIWKRS